jgi:hypothetical protein
MFARLIYAWDVFSKVVGTLVAVICICASSLFAAEFGWHRGDTLVMQVAFAAVGGGLDVLKFMLPMWGSQCRRGGEPQKANMCWVGFWFLTVASLWAGWGVASIQLAEKLATQKSVTSEMDQKAGTLSRLKDERTKLPTFQPTSAEALAAAQKAAEMADAAVTQECKTGVGANCRGRQNDAKAAHDNMTKVASDKAATDQARDLDAKIETAEMALSTVDVRTATEDTDPLSASISKATGMREAVAQLISQLFVSGLVEFGSGMLLYLIWGHGEAKVVAMAAPADSAPMTVDTTAQAIDVVEFPRNPDEYETRDKFFKTGTIPSPGRRASHTDIFAGYQKFCAESGQTAMNVHKFGRQSHPNKKTIGGKVWYQDMILAPRYAVKGPVLKLVSSA